MHRQLRESLRKKKLRITSPREKIYQVLFESPLALTPKEVFQKIKDDTPTNTDLVSVYRNLTLFTELGLTHRFQDGRYSACKQAESHHDHVHVIATCSDCGNTFEIEEHTEDVCAMAHKMKEIAPQFEGFTSITFEGYCSKCSSK